MGDNGYDDEGSHLEPLGERAGDPGFGVKRKPPFPDAVPFLREAFWNDGAEGESVHLVCDEVEHLRAKVEELYSIIDSAVEASASVERYEPTVVCVRGHAPMADVEEDPEGAWVSWYSYEELLTADAALEALTEKLEGVWDLAREYDSGYPEPSSSEAHDLWSCIEDKPHKALRYIDDVLKRRVEERVKELEGELARMKEFHAVCAEATHGGDDEDEGT